MASISCGCGHVFSDAQIPNPYEFTLVPDDKIETLTDELRQLIARHGDLDAELPYLLSKVGTTGYRCPKCSKLLLFESGIAKPAAIYTAEESVAQ